MMLIQAALSAPLIACDPKHRETFHAATMEAVVHGWPKSDEDTDPSVISACGVEGLKLLKAPWPPRVASLPNGFTRCRACHIATGKRRPRMDFAPNARFVDDRETR